MNIVEFRLKCLTVGRAIFVSLFINNMLFMLNVRTNIDNIIRCTIDALCNYFALNNIVFLLLYRPYAWCWMHSQIQPKYSLIFAHIACNFNFFSVLFLCFSSLDFNEIATFSDKPKNSLCNRVAAGVESMLDFKTPEMKCNLMKIALYAVHWCFGCCCSWCR